MLKPIQQIKARDLCDAWYQCLSHIFTGSHSEIYRVEEGSYKGSLRLEFDTLVLDITHPAVGPLVPAMPPGKEHLAPCTKEQVEAYARYIQTSLRCENESYTYGERIVPQLNCIDDMIRSGKHNTNQMTVEVGRPSDIHKKDPPCLRVLDFRIREGVLHLFAYFRSWDIYNGLPVNLGGLLQLMQAIAGRHCLEVGSIRAFSKGAHIYSAMWPMARERLGLV